MKEFEPGKRIEVHPKQLEEVQNSLKRVEVQLKDITGKLQNNGTNEFLTVKEVCTLLKIGRSTCADWTKRKFLKSYKISGKKFYKRNEVEQAFKEG